jgi:hypothetical protein
MPYLRMEIAPRMKKKSNITHLAIASASTHSASNTSVAHGEEARAESFER